MEHRGKLLWRHGLGHPGRLGLFDLRGSGLQLSNLTIVDEDFQTTITSARGTITISVSFGQEVFIDEDDFLF